MTYYIWLNGTLISKRTFPMTEPDYLRRILRAENAR
jgi:hypothetical protein